LAALELNEDIDPGVLVHYEVRNDVQLEVVEAMAKRRLQNLPAVVTGGD
jgi:hypothetical protein